MFSKYIKITALLLALLMLTACAAPTNDTPPTPTPALVTVESCTSEVPVESPAETPAPWLDYAINSPEMAEETVRAELAKMQELGLLAEQLYIAESPADFVEFFDDELFLSRTGRPIWAVRWYCDSWYENNWQGDSRYGVSANLDAQSGKLLYVSIEAAADKDAEVVYTAPVEVEIYDEQSGETKLVEEEWLYHENFSDIFDVDMSTNTFCDLLNEYWGFNGWTLGGGGALNLQVPLTDLTAGTTGYYYVAFSFDGDEEGKHMYVQLNEFPGRVCLMFGTDHAVG